MTPGCRLRGKITQFITGSKPTQEIYDEEKISELDSYGSERNGDSRILNKNVENQNITENNHAKKIDGIYQFYNHYAEKKGANK